MNTLIKSSLVRSAALLKSSRAPASAAAPASSLTMEDLTRNFSTAMRLRRPPRRGEGASDAPISNNNTAINNRNKLRTHAVSLQIGDYSDDNNATDFDDDDLLLNGSNKDEDWQNEELELSNYVKEQWSEEELRKQKWLQNSRPPIRVSEIDERGRAYGRGGRKTASARVWVQPGFGMITVNKKDYVDYFDRTTDRELIISPLAATATLGKMDVTAIVQGGGLTGQAGAIRHGLARALNAYNPDVYRPPLKRLGYLTRDPRKVERKKIGHVKARKKPQWVKR
jgi:small subunit ribosomal protein S9